MASGHTNQRMCFVCVRLIPRRLQCSCMDPLHLLRSCPSAPVGSGVDVGLCTCLRWKDRAHLCTAGATESCKSPQFSVPEQEMIIPWERPGLALPMSRPGVISCACKLRVPSATPGPCSARQRSTFTKLRAKTLGFGGLDLHPRRCCSSRHLQAMSLAPFPSARQACEEVRSQKSEDKPGDLEKLDT